jgi:hypothetical protein
MTEEEYFTRFVYGVFNDLGEPEDYPLAKISAWFLDEANIGKLNTLIGTNISLVIHKDSEGVVSGYELKPTPTPAQLGIFKNLFQCEFFKNYAKNLARSAAQLGDWTSLREGDSSIQRANKNEISKNFRIMSKDCEMELNKKVKMYLKYECTPEQIVGDDTIGASLYLSKDYVRSF